MSEVLSVKNLTLKNKTKTIFEDISFSLKKGTITVLCGHNGAGKSRLFRTIKGLQKETSGKVFINGEEKKGRERILEVALVFQDADLQIVGETVYKDCAFGPENLGLNQNEIEKRVNEVLSLLSLNDKKNQRATTLSGGEKRRLAIAGVLAMKPELIMLDEPFANLDYPSSIVLIKTLLELKEKGHTLLIISHEVEKFLSHADSVLIMKEGKLIFKGEAKDSLEQLKENNIYLPNKSFEDLTWL